MLNLISHSIKLKPILRVEGVDISKMGRYVSHTGNFSAQHKRKKHMKTLVYSFACVSLLVSMVQAMEKEGTQSKETEKKQVADQPTERIAAFEKELIELESRIIALRSSVNNAELEEKSKHGLAEIRDTLVGELNELDKNIRAANLDAETTQSLRIRYFPLWGILGKLNLPQTTANATQKLSPAAQKAGKETKGAVQNTKDQEREAARKRVEDAQRAFDQKRIEDYQRKLEKRRAKIEKEKGEDEADLKRWEEARLKEIADAQAKYAQEKS